MKNIVLTGLFMLLCGGAVAAAGSPSADTIRPTTFPPSYFLTPYLNVTDVDTIFNWRFSTVYQYEGEETWHSRYLSDSIERVFGVRNGNHIVGVQLMTERPLKIVGLAACGYMQAPRDTTIQEYMDFDPKRFPNFFVTNTRNPSPTARITDSLILYKPTPDGLVELMSAPWRIEQQHRHIILPPQSLQSDRSGGMESILFHLSDPSWVGPSPTVALYEAHFPKPVVVEDSFVVAGTALNNDGSYGPAYIPVLGEQHPVWMWRWDYCPTRYWNLIVIADLEVMWSHNRKWRWWRKHRHHPWVSYIAAMGMVEPPGDTVEYLERNSPLIFPIIDPSFDTVIEHCLPVDNLRVAESSDTSATLIWDAPNSTLWEVKYGLVGMADSDYTVLTVTAPTATLTGLVVGMQYKAFVRGWCPCDDSWTPWTPGCTFRQQRHEGIGQPGALGAFTQLMPNPAHGAFSVLSSFALSRVVVYDLQGRIVADQAAEGISAVVDISSLPAGTYIAALHTSAGIATKRLLVQ